ncbi:Unknown protein [Striga hermonthica]|uniref:F-box domain-containing protein n=1 Tax=Striga hermonthica TaxID=68872 RepID=A0A9N7MPQ0_STRHE|nr:Unknown protein [Striga hermonthica]
MAKFPSPIFRLPPPSSPPSSGEASEAEGIADGKKLCAQNSLLISLPDDLLLKILSNLSAQDIYYRASRVCRKLYYHTIRSEEFVNLHLRQQTEDYGLLFRFIYNPTRGFVNDKYPSPHVAFVSMKQGRVTVSDHYYAYKSGFWSGCNGLILEYNFPVPSSGVLVVNPVTGGAFRLPPLPENKKFMQCCVGYVEASKAYKVALSYYDAAGRDTRWAILTVGTDSWWRNLATNQYSIDAAIRLPLVTEGFIYFFLQNTVLTLNLETEVMTEIRAPKHPKGKKQYLSTGKSLTLVVQVEEFVFQVWEMVCGDHSCYYWRKWEHQIALGNEIQSLFCIQPVGWLQQMEVLVFTSTSINEPCKVFYVIIATGEIGWITSILKGLVGGDYTLGCLPHKNTLVQLEGH